MPSEVWVELARFTRGPMTLIVSRSKDPVLFKMRYRAVSYVMGAEAGKVFGTDPADVVARAPVAMDGLADQACLLADDVAAYSAGLGAA